LIVSEYPLGTPPLAPNFPRRNRLIAGLSCATLVVEAALQSGSLITARLAADQGKDVFAIPGSIHSTLSHGCHALIRQGAKLVESAQDVLEEMPGFAPGLHTGADSAGDDSAGRDESNDSLLGAMGFDPVSLDAMQARTGLDTAQLQARLMALELERNVVRLPGGLFLRMVRT
jgi:DNA processing protein